MADNNNPFGLPAPIVPGGDPASTPISVFREAMGTVMPQIPNGQPMSVPTGLNLSGNYQTGPNPVAKASNGTMDILQQNVNMLNQASNWAQDKNAYGRTYFYGAGIHGANFERYYNHPKFKDLGFNPLRNNEVVYNQASSWWDDFNRMTSSFSGLFGAGFKSMYDFGSKDTAKEYEKAMAVGMTSKGGVGGFFTNLALNSAFTMGIVTEMLAENFAIAGITAATGGLAAAPALAAAAGRNAMGFQKVFQMQDALRGTKETLTQLSNVNKAREMWNSGKGVSTMGKVADFINPMSRTTDYISNMYKGTNGFDKMNDFVKTRKAFGAMYRDLREVNAVFAESLMEGEMSKNEFNQKLIDDYYNKNGVMPEGEAAQRIYDTSMNVGFATSLANAPAIYFSNKLVFDSIFNGFKPPSVVGRELIEGSKRELTKNKNWKLGDNVYSFMERQSGQKLKNTLFNSSYSPLSKKYMLGNLSEGIQEVTQDIVSASATRYYEDIYNDPTAAGLYNGLVAVGSATNNQFSMKGLETFLSGYLMGSLVQPIGAIGTSPMWAPGLYNKYFKSEEYQKQVQKERDNENNIVNAVNTILKNPLGYFDRNVEHAVRSKKLNQEMEQAQLDGDQKAYQDAKEQLSYEHLMLVTETGKTDMLNEQLDGMLDMTDNELEEAFSQKGEGAAIRKRLEDSKQQVLEFKNTYDAFTEKYQNPFNPQAFNPEKDKDGWNKEMAKFIGFEDARRDAVMAVSLYGKTVSRMQSLFNDLSANKVIRNAKTNDFTTLLSQGDLSEEINLLKREIEVLNEGDAQQKKLAKTKQKKLDTLKDFKNFSLTYQMALKESRRELTRAEKKARSLSLGSIVKSKRTGEKLEIIEDLGEFIRVETKSGMRKRFKKKNVLPVTDGVIMVMRKSNQELYKKFIDYSNSVAQDNNDQRVSKEGLDDAFIKVRDWFNLNEDAQNLVETVNMLHNPSMFMRHAEQQALIQEFKRENLPGYVRASYRKMHENFKDSNFLNEIYDLGLTIDPDDAKRIIFNKDYTNLNFYYQTSGEPVDSKDPKLAQAKKIVEKYQEISKIKEEAEAKTDGVQEPEEEEQVEEKPAESAATPEEQIPNYEIYKQLVALFRKSELAKANNGEATAGLEDVADNDLRNKEAFLSFITSNSEAIALTEKLPKAGEKAKPSEKEIKELDWTPKPVPAGLEKLRNLYKEVLYLTNDENNYFNQLGELWDRVSSIKREKTGLPGKDILELASQRGNIIDIVIREMFKGNIQNKVDMLNLIKGIVRKENYSVQFDNRAVTQLYTILNDVYTSVKEQGFTIHSDIPTLFGTIKGLNTPQGGAIAGTIDLLAEKDGKFYIIDLKTATADRKSEEGKGRYLEDDTIQLNAYRELIKQQTGVDIEGIFIFPMTVTQGKGYKVISSVTAPKFTMDELIPIEKKSLKELRPELFEEAPGAAPTPVTPAPATPAPAAPVSNTDLSNVESFETSKGSVYTILPDGKVERFKTAANEKHEPAELIVFVKFDNSDQEEDFLSAQHRQGGMKLYVIDAEGNIYNKNSEVAGKNVKLAIIKDNKVLAAIDASTEPKIGYNTFDQRRFEKDGEKYRSTHLGNDVTKINYKSPTAPVSDKKADIEKTLYGTISGSIPLSQALPNGIYIDLGNGLFAYADKNEKIAAIVDKNNNYLVSKSFWNENDKKWQLPNLANLKDDAAKLGVDEAVYIKKYQDAVGGLNVKYDAELAALEGAPTAPAAPTASTTKSVVYLRPDSNFGYETEEKARTAYAAYMQKVYEEDLEKIPELLKYLKYLKDYNLADGEISEKEFIEKINNPEYFAAIKKLHNEDYDRWYKRNSASAERKDFTDINQIYKLAVILLARQKGFNKNEVKEEVNIKAVITDKKPGQRIYDYKTVEEVKTEPEVKGETLESMVEQVKDPAGYEALRTKLFEKLSSDAAFRNKYNLTADTVKEILKNKYNELAMTFTSEDIKADKKTFVILKDGSEAVVTERTKSTFTYQRMVNGSPEGATIERPISQIYDAIQSVYKAGMENIKPVEPVVAEPVAADSKAESDSSIKDANDPGVVQDTANEAIASTMNKGEAMENLKNKLC